MIPEDLATVLARRFGPLYTVATKPFSVHQRDVNNTVLVKVYRHIEPVARMTREVEALAAGAHYGVRVPRPLGYGRYQALAWVAIAVVPGEPLHLRTITDAHTFLVTARSALAPLHAAPQAGGAGSGWSRHSTARVSTHLAAQLRDQFRALPAWPHLHTQIQILDELPVARLHGDVKPAHFLLDRDGSVTVVDWEASHQGPVILDEVDIAFRVIREAIYGELEPPEDELAALTASPAHVAGLAWRIALWLDRRHHTLTDSVAALVGQTAGLPGAKEPRGAVLAIMRAAQSLGTRY